MMNFKMLLRIFWLPMSLLFCLAAADADVATDGTVGRSGALAGPNYEIDSNSGKQAGGNLFHSFSRFNIGRNESAQFTGSETVNNIIARVTGGNPSHIDGRMQSQIPGANLYFLNPSGVMIGPDAVIDVDGSFHVSTADYLRLGNGGRFDASHTGQSTFTSAPPEAFGFIKPPADINVRGKIRAAGDETISLTGGNIEIDGGLIYAKSGRIDITAVASAGEVRMTDHGPDISAFTRLGDIRIANAAKVDVSDTGTPEEDDSLADDAGKMKTDSFGEAGRIFMRGKSMNITSQADKAIEKTSDSSDGAGRIFIRGKNLHVTDPNTQVVSITGDNNGGEIDIGLTENLTVTNQSRINTLTVGSGRGGDVELNVGYLSVTGDATIGAVSYAGGAAGDIEVNARKGVTISGYQSFPSNLDTSSYGEGPGGSVEITTDRLSVTHGGMIQIKSYKQGRGGDIELKAIRMDVTDHGVITTDCQGSGAGGDIVVRARDAVRISDSGRLSAISQSAGYGGDAGDISIDTSGKLTVSDDGVITGGTLGSGRGGNITIDADTMEIDRGYVSSSTRGSGSGGNITVDARRSLTVAGSGTAGEGRFGEYYGIYAQTLASGDGGHITVRTPIMTLTEDAMINGQTYGRGKGGDVTLNTDRLDINAGGTVTVSTRGAGRGGDINITATDSVNLSGKGVKLAKSQIYSAAHSAGKGGDITIRTPALNVDTQGAIFADTLGDDTRDGNTLAAGDAGNIRLEADRLALKNGGAVQAGSQCAGRGGDITMDVKQLTVHNGASVSSQSTASGDAGSITVHAEDRVEMENSAVTVQALNADGGDIAIYPGYRLYMIDSSVTAAVAGGKGDGGNIHITKPKFVILNDSDILADAYGGKGGNIDINADYFVSSADSRIDASSQLGIDGRVNVDALDADVGGSITMLPETFSDTPLLIERCDFKRSEASSFIINGQSGWPQSPDDFLWDNLP
ncbi:filamentous hemagglutinin N-terminal domain-containing protein [Desulfococcaceae bacterium HSG9]|nr:filamentous hemagglutinin N-terminal domain-containing protein [Desulfococcaceae bacterium HSG9]